MGSEQQKVVYLTDRPESREVLLARTFEEHKTALRRFLKARLAREEDREDILQELFLRLARVDNLSERLSERLGNTRSYLFSIATNLVVDRYRKAAQEREEQHDSFDESLPHTELPSPEMVTATQQQLDRMLTLLRSMPAKQRKAFVLNRFKHRSYPEVARDMGVSVASVQRYISAALVRLRQGM